MRGKAWRRCDLPCWAAILPWQRRPMRANPFAAPSTLPYQAPRFDIIKDSDYQPAFEAGMKEQLAEIKQIADNPAPPTFDNTIAAMERSGRMLDRVNNTFFGVVQANTNPTLDKVQTAEAPRLAAHHDAIFLNPKLFARVKTLYDDARQPQAGCRSAAGADALLPPVRACRRALVGQGQDQAAGDQQGRCQPGDPVPAEAGRRRQGRRAGAGRQGRACGPVGCGNRQHGGSRQGARADRQVCHPAAEHHPAAVADLAVRPRGARETVQQQLDARGKRRRQRHPRRHRAAGGHPRAKGQTAGLSQYAAYVLYDQMANTPEMVEKFLGQLVGPTRAKAADEARLIQAAIDKDGKHFDLKPWDWQRYAEQVRKERYDLDENALKPYFEIHKVLTDGVFYAANRLYGLTFKERHDIPVYQPDVMVYEVFDHDGSSLGLMYFDYYKRDNKSGGAWMSNFVGQSKLLGTKPVIYNVANFTKPAPGQPALISFDDVTTMFHEFGHALHGLFANQTYPLVSGTNVARDFVEFPSQFNEHWALYPEVLKHYAMNYKTGAPIPQSLVDKIKASDTWGQGYSLGELLAASELDMKWHTLPADAPNRMSTPSRPRRSRIPAPIFPMCHRAIAPAISCTSGPTAMQSGYYAYQWTVMLDDDAFAWFTAHGGLTRANGQRFRDLILSKGHTLDYGPMFRAFYGKDPDIGPMLEHRGLKPLPK